MSNASILRAALLATVIGCAGFAPAHAVVIATGVSNADTDNVLSNSCTGNAQAGNPVQGCLNGSDGFYINFTGDENMTYQGGQATLDAADGTFDSVSITYSDGATFQKLVLNLDVLDIQRVNNDGFVTFTVDLLTGVDFVQAFAISENGQNFFNITAGAGERILGVSLLTTVQLADIKQVRIGGRQLDVPPPPVDTPEPAALALFGFGLLGLAATRRRRA